MYLNQDSQPNSTNASTTRITYKPLNKQAFITYIICFSLSNENIIEHFSNENIMYGGGIIMRHYRVLFTTIDHGINH
jgi:hypothetical protein